MITDTKVSPLDSVLQHQTSDIDSSVNAATASSAHKRRKNQPKIKNARIKTGLVAGNNCTFALFAAC